MKDTLTLLRETALEYQRQKKLIAIPAAGGDAPIALGVAIALGVDTTNRPNQHEN